MHSDYDSSLCEMSVTFICNSVLSSRHHHYIRNTDADTSVYDQQDMDWKWLWLHLIHLYRGYFKTNAMKYEDKNIFIIMKHAHDGLLHYMHMFIYTYVTIPAIRYVYIHLYYYSSYTTQIERRQLTWSVLYRKHIENTYNIH